MNVDAVRAVTWLVILVYSAASWYGVVRAVQAGF